MPHSGTREGLVAVARAAEALLAASASRVAEEGSAEAAAFARAAFKFALSGWADASLYERLASRVGAVAARVLAAVAGGKKAGSAAGKPPHLEAPDWRQRPVSVQ